jgi:lysophospholipase L1-like esterase
MAPTYPGNGSFDLRIDGGAATVLTTNAAAGMTKLVVTATSAGIHTLTVTPQAANAGTTYLGWIDAWNGAAPAIGIANMGFPGSTAGQWTDSGAPYRSPFAVPYYGAALAIVDLGINDWKDAGTGVAAFRTTYQSLIATLKAGGSDVIVLVPFPSSTSRAPVAQQAAYIQVLYALAKANNCVLIDMTRRFGSYAQQAALTPSQYADALHPKATLYANAARLIASVLLR